MKSTLPQNLRLIIIKLAMFLVKVKYNTVSDKISSGNFTPICNKNSRTSLAKWGHTRDYDSIVASMPTNEKWHKRLSISHMHTSMCTKVPPHRHATRTWEGLLKN